jgi:hypothetical protein
LAKREQYHQIINYKYIVNINIPGKEFRDTLSDTKDVYTCSCGSTMTNRYKVRRRHSLSTPHRERIREIHLDMISNNPDFEFIEIEIKQFEVVYGDEGITLNIKY